MCQCHLLAGILFLTLCIHASAHVHVDDTLQYQFGALRLYMSAYSNMYKPINYRRTIFLKYYSTCVPTLHIVCSRRIEITTFSSYLPPSAVRA